MKKTYILNPNLTYHTLKINPSLIKPDGGALPPAKAEHKAITQIVDTIAPALPPSPKAQLIETAQTKTLPERQPLPAPVLYPNKPTLKLGLDVHLEFIMAVAQRDHSSPQAPRKFSFRQLVFQVQQWVAEGLVVYGVAEACGFGF